jgi:diguanylate cyclase (GGDEF)-like protein
MNSWKTTEAASATGMSSSFDTSSLLNFIVERAHVGIFVIDRRREIVLWNQFMAIHSERSAAEVIGKNLFDLFPELPRKWLERKIESVFQLKNFSFSSWEQRPYLFRFNHNRPVTGGVDCMRQDCTLMPMKDAAGEVPYICFTLFDVTDTSLYQTQLKKVMAELEETSNLDGLTKLYNRRYLESALTREFSLAQRHGHPLSVILADIDHFKRINDTYGHLVGDDVLREVSRLLKHAVRDSDVMGRYGGEEFLILLPETKLEGARELGERLRRLIEHTPMQFGKDAPVVTISLGISTLTPRTATHQELVSEADKALYFSKAAGRNRASLFVCTSG